MVINFKSERAQMLRDIGDKLMAQKDKIAMIETLNNGKPIRETQQLIFHLLQDISIISQVLFKKQKKGTVNDIDKDTMSIVRHERIGVEVKRLLLELPNAISCMEDCASHCCRQYNCDSTFVFNTIKFIGSC